MLAMNTIWRRVSNQGIPVFLICFLFLINWGIIRLPQTMFFRNYSFTKLLAQGLGSAGEEFKPPSFFSGILFFLTGLDPFYLPGVFERGLPVVALEGSAAAQSVFTQLTKESGERLLLDERSEFREDFEKKEVEVVFYHTHNAETYIPLHGKSKVEGENGGVKDVAGEMVRVLEKAGIKTVHDLTIHDHPDFPISYIKSEATARRLVQENPFLKALIDVHRDAGLSKKETVNVNGQEVARILLIVGTGERLPNPQWRENYAFAQSIAHRLEEKYPGVLKGLRLRPGRYNQHLSPRVLLVEVGSDKNTLAEALGSARLFATVLAEVIQEKK